MKVTLGDIGKRYASAHWVFKGLSLTIHAGDRIAITGNNGSGKSTLLQIIAGLISPSVGQVQYFDQGKELDKEIALQQMYFTAPYLELIQEFSVIELLQFHFKFKPLIRTENFSTLIQALYLEGNERKWIKNLSSGMKQRLKLGLMFYSGSHLILLDEPTTNLDEQGIQWYHEHIMRLPPEAIVIVASNQKQEYIFCDKIIQMEKEFRK